MNPQTATEQQASTSDSVEDVSINKMRTRARAYWPKIKRMRQYKDDQGRIIWYKDHTLVYLLLGKKADTWFNFLLSKYGPPIFYAIQVGLLYLWFFVYPPDAIQNVVLPVLVSVLFFVFYISAVDLQILFKSNLRSRQFYVDLYLVATYTIAEYAMARSPDTAKALNVMVNLFLYGFLMLVDTLPRNWLRNRYIVPTYIIMLAMQCYILVYVNISIKDDWADQQVTLFSFSIDEQDTRPIELNALSLYTSSAIAFILIMFWSMVGLIWSGKGAAYMRYAAVAVDAYLPPKQESTPPNNTSNKSMVDSKKEKLNLEQENSAPLG